MIPVGLPSLINPMNTPATDKTRSNSHSMSIDRRAITESHESIQKIMLKRLNYIQFTLDGYDPVKTKRQYKQKIEGSRNKRIWEIWKEDLNQFDAKDIAIKINEEKKSRNSLDNYDAMIKNIQNSDISSRLKSVDNN